MQKINGEKVNHSSDNDEINPKKMVKRKNPEIRQKRPTLILAESEDEDDKEASQNSEGKQKIEKSQWVQCDNPDCQKWRRIDYMIDMNDINDAIWVCDMNRDQRKAACEASQETIGTEDEDICNTGHEAGMILWGKVPGYPWWPCMVDDDPDIDTFFWNESCSTSSEPKTSIHVTFFGKECSRAWLHPCSLRQFTGEENIKDMGTMTYRGKNYKHQVLESMTDAKESLKLSVEERIAKYGFAVRFNGEEYAANSDDSKDRDKNKMKKAKVTYHDSKSKDEKRRKMKKEHSETKRRTAKVEKNNHPKKIKTDFVSKVKKSKEKAKKKLKTIIKGMESSKKDMFSASNITSNIGIPCIDEETGNNWSCESNVGSCSNSSFEEPTFRESTSKNVSKASSQVSQGSGKNIADPAQLGPLTKSESWQLTKEEMNSVPTLVKPTLVPIDEKLVSKRAEHMMKKAKKFLQKKNKIKDDCSTSNTNDDLDNFEEAKKNDSDHTRKQMTKTKKSSEIQDAKKAKSKGKGDKKAAGIVKKNNEEQIKLPFSETSSEKSVQNIEVEEKKKVKKKKEVTANEKKFESCIVKKPKEKIGAIHKSDHSAKRIDTDIGYLGETESDNYSVEKKKNIIKKSKKEFSIATKGKIVPSSAGHENCVAKLEGTSSQNGHPKFDMKMKKCKDTSNMGKYSKLLEENGNQSESMQRSTFSATNFSVVNKSGSVSKQKQKFDEKRDAPTEKTSRDKSVKKKSMKKSCFSVPMKKEHEDRSNKAEHNSLPGFTDTNKKVSSPLKRKLDTKSSPRLGKKNVGKESMFKNNDGYCMTVMADYANDFVDLEGNITFNGSMKALLQEDPIAEVKQRSKKKKVRNMNDNDITKVKSKRIVICSESSDEMGQNEDSPLKAKKARNDELSQEIISFEEANDIIGDSFLKSSIDLSELVTKTASDAASQLSSFSVPEHAAVNDSPFVPPTDEDDLSTLLSNRVTYPEDNASNEYSNAMDQVTPVVKKFEDDSDDSSEF